MPNFIIRYPNSGKITYQTLFDVLKKIYMEPSIEMKQLQYYSIFVDDKGLFSNKVANKVERSIRDKTCFVAKDGKNIIVKSYQTYLRLTPDGKIEKLTSDPVVDKVFKLSKSESGDLRKLLQCVGIYS